MAKMYPSQLPPEIRADPGREAEVAVYDALEVQLPDAFSVFYSVGWNGPLGARDAVRDGEADFVVAHPNLGFLVLEVKGGTVDYDPEHPDYAGGAWTSTTKSGQVHRIHDPFEQAKKSCYGLGGRLTKSLAQAGSVGGSLKLFHATVFPHCRIRAEEVPGVSSPEIVIDVDGLREVDKRIGKAFAYWLNGSNLRGPAFEEVLGALKQMHQKPLHGRREMAVEIADHHAEFDRLTENQARLLKAVERNPRLLVTGCAGSGKTFLAKRLAVKHAAQTRADGQPKRVLVLCFNNLLGQRLQEELGGLPNVMATNFHHACELLAASGGRVLPELDPANARPYYEALIDAALTALETHPALCFDTVIMDEAQDFEFDWWVVISACLRSPGTLCVFTDANQLLYGEGREVPSALGPFMELDLPENVRNTQAIHREANRFYQGEFAPSATGPEGINPTYIEAVDWAAQLVELQILLTRLIGEQRVSPQDIAVLTPRGFSSSALNSVSQVGAFRLVPYEDRGPGDIGWSTVRRFKGLESPVVVLLELDDVLNSSRARELAYVAVSRARDFLYVLGSSAAIRGWKSR